MRRLTLIAVVASVLWSIGPSRTALAHEIVVIGPYWLNIGWQSEPLLVGEKNAVLITAANAETSAMVESLSTMTISISTGAAVNSRCLRPLPKTSRASLWPIYPHGARRLHAGVARDAG